MLRRKWILGTFLAALPLSVSCENVGDFPYVFLTGFSQRELVQLSYLSAPELEERTGLPEVPGGFAGDRKAGRAAHAIASYLGTRRWGPDLTLAFGYLREYVPWLLFQKQADPLDIAANYAGVSYALHEETRPE